MEDLPSPTEKALQRYQTLLVCTVAVAIFADSLLMTIIVPIAPDLVGGDHPALIGVLFASKAILQVLFGPLTAMIIPKIGPQPTLQIGLVILTLSTIAFAFLSDLGALIAARAVQGIASSLINAGGLSWVAEAHRPEERGTATAGAMAGLAAGVLFGPTIGGLLYPVKLWDFAHATPFCCVAGVILLDAIVQLTLNAAHPGDSTAIGEEKEEEEEGIEPSLGTLLCDRQVLIGMAALIVSNGVISSLEPTVPLYLQQQFGYGP